MIKELSPRFHYALEVLKECSGNDSWALGPFRGTAVGLVQEKTVPSVERLGDVAALRERGGPGLPVGED